MTIKITSLFATVTIAGILSMAPFMANSNQAFAGGCNELVSPTLADLLADSNNCILVDDKTFIDFRNFNGDILFFDGSLVSFDPADINVEGVTVSGEHGLMFTPNPNTLFVVSGTNPAASAEAITIVFDYDLFSDGDLISDNTLTMESVFNGPQTPQTRAEITEQVHPDHDQLKPFIALKLVFEDGTGAFDKDEHVDFASSHPEISVNTDIGLILGPNDAGLGTAEITKFTQTFSQESEVPPPPVGGEFLPINTAALLVAGAQTNAVWILSALAVIGSIAFGALYLTTRRD